MTEVRDIRLFVAIEEAEFRVLIKHYFLRKKTIKKNRRHSHSHFTVDKLFTKIRCGRTSTKTIPSPGRPKEVTNEEIVNKIHDKVKIIEIADIVN